MAEVLYLKADLKYVMARTREREYLLDESLTHLETEFAERFIRLHRSVLVARGNCRLRTQYGGRGGHPLAGAGA